MTMKMKRALQRLPAVQLLSYTDLLLLLLLLHSHLLSFASAAARQLLENSNGHLHHSPSVIIIGAGMSGIMAAKTLAESGVKEIVILEATERIGGRMRKATIGGMTVELGANWVEGIGGEEENPIWTLAKKNSLRTFYSDFENLTSNFYDEEGKLIPLTIVEPRYKLLEASKEFCDTLSESLNTNKEEDIPILSAQRMFGQMKHAHTKMRANTESMRRQPVRRNSLKRHIF